MQRITTDEAVRILELDGHLDDGAIKRAYRRLAREHHPDRGGDAVTFQRIRAAYEVLYPTVAGGEGGPRAASAPGAPSVDGRWWGSSSRWYEGVVDTGSVDWDRPVPEARAYPLTRDLLAVRLAADGPGPVAPVTARSRYPGSRLHRVIGLLQADLLAEVAIGPAAHEGIRGHDVTVRMVFRSLRARRQINGAALPRGWVRSRGSSSTTVRRTLHPCVVREGTAVRVADLVAEALDAAAWPLTDWYVVER